MKYIYLLIIIVVITFTDCSVSVGDDKFPIEKNFSELYSMNLESKVLTQLTFDKQPISFMQYLPQSDKILFVQDGTFIVNVDGSNRRKLSNKSIISVTNWYIPYLVIASDERYAFYSITQWNAGAKSFSTIYSLALSNGEETIVLQDSSWINELSVSQNGDSIIFQASKTITESTALYLFDLNTKLKIQLQQHPDYQYFFPQFVPNERKIVFFEHRNGLMENVLITLFDLDDSSNTLILDSAIIQNRIYSSLNSSGSIFYNYNGLKILNVKTNQRILVPFLISSNSKYDYVNWSYDKSSIIFSNNNLSEIVIYNLGNSVNAIIKPLLEGPVEETRGPIRFPYLRYNNVDIYFSIQYSETVLN